MRLTGTLHVSLLSDIIQLFGTGSVPAVVAGSVLGVFELGERFASQRAKDALSKWLLTFDVKKAGALPDGTQELFERIFGERHFTLKCFIRSAAVSIGAMVFIGILFVLISPQQFLKSIPSDLPVFLALWVPWSILIDYVSLYKTRLILGILSRMRRRNAMVAIAIVGIDYLVYRLIFSVGLVCLFFVRWRWAVASLGIADVLEIWPAVLQIWWRTDVLSFWWTEDFFPHVIAFFNLLFWAGFAPKAELIAALEELIGPMNVFRAHLPVSFFRSAPDVISGDAQYPPCLLEQLGIDRARL